VFRTLSTQRLARASAGRPKLVLTAWLAAFVAAGLAIAMLLGTSLTSDDDFTNRPESKRAERIADAAFATARGAGQFEADATVVVHVPQGGRLRAAVRSVEHRLSAIPPRGALRLRDPFAGDGTDRSLVSGDGRTALLHLDLDRVSDGYVEQLIETIEALDRQAGSEVAVTGERIVDADMEQTAESDLVRGEQLGLAAALVVLLVVFGSLVASLVPLAVAVVSIVVALGLTALVGQAWELAFFVVNMLVMMGLAVGVDYSLFVVSRFREERRNGYERLDAIERAGATSSRAVLFSGLTVVIALIGMFVVPHTIFRSLAVGAITVVLVSVGAALTLVPALLSLLGDRVDALRLPLVGRSRGALWARIAQAVMRRPVVSLAASVAVLLALAAPYAWVQTGSSGVSTLPDSFASKRAFDLIDREFGPPDSSTAEVVVSGDVRSPFSRAAVARLRAALARDARYGELTAEVAPAGDAAILFVPIAGDPVGRRATDAVRDLRHDYLPSAFAGSGVDPLVMGQTAGELDFHELAARYQPIVFALVLGLSFLLLVVAFRSLVVAGTAIGANLLSVGAAYGLLVLVFQEGVGAGLLGFTQSDTVEAWLPLFLFSVLFGLSMDYHVFLLSRIRERWLERGDTAEAVAFGIRSTGRIITGAALIMVAVFSGFATGELVMFQQMGFGLGAAILLDATVVRCVLVPATMKLLGRWNWWLPRGLAWLPEVSVEGRPVVEKA
jgi:putative drug exporter of the RND superfamily